MLAHHLTSPIRDRRTPRRGPRVDHASQDFQTRAIALPAAAARVLNELLSDRVHNGPYRCGFAPSQADHEREVRSLFAALDGLEERLADRRYLFGDHITDSDVRLWVTLVRFDSVYVTHFKANLRRIVDYPNLWGYARDLYAREEFRSTTDFEQTKRHYFLTHTWINPSNLVPLGPELDWDAPADRARLADA
jgi:putative glutathione S-transferase